MRFYVSHSIFYLAVSVLLTCGFSFKASALPVEDAVHLLSRTGFGASPRDIASLRNLTRAQAVDHILATLDAPVVGVRPPFTSMPRPDYWADGWMSQDNIRLRENEIAQLQDWWLGEMIATPAPFRERMALFWHNQFVSRYDPTTLTAPFVEQLALFRSAGIGNYRDLIVGIMHDPMMLSFLDNVKNSKEHPNENLARELLELFTLGAGNYSEHDIKELARVLAGHHVAVSNGWTYRIDQASLDTGEKQILGARIAGPPEAELRQVADAILRQKAASTFLARRLYRAFVSLDIDAAAVSRIAGHLRDTDYDIRPTLRAMLLDEAFWAPRNRAALVKSPIELIVGFTRQFNVHMPDLHILNIYSAMLGQELFDPPTVAGWREGEDWMTTGSLSLRRRVIDRLWAAYDVDHVQDPHPGAVGLRVRYSSEGTTRPATVRIIVDGQALPDVSARHGIDVTRESASNDPNNLKPMWETLFIPLEKLPATPRKIAVSFVNADKDTHLFVNWIEWKGRRLSPMQAQWEARTSACPGETPRGMFYCNATLAFDLSGQAQQQDASLADREAPLNSQIEYGTARLKPALFQVALDQASPVAFAPQLLATAPFMTAAAPQPDEDALAFARRVTADPAYNLK